MTVRRSLVAIALAILVGAQPSAAIADAYDGGARAPASAAHENRVVTIADVARAKHGARRAPRERGIFSKENTPLGIGGGATSKTKSSSGIGGGSIVRTMLGLIVVIAAIYAVAWVLRRVKRSREDQASGRGLQSIATLPLGSGRTLHLVRAGTDVILVGSSEHGVAPIQRYTEEDALANGLLSEYGQDAALRGAAASFMPDGTPVAAGGGAAVPGQWRAIDAPASGTGSGIVDALRRLTVRQ
jgi:flagellar protein FliO/FliZ